MKLVISPLFGLKLYLPNREKGRDQMAPLPKVVIINLGSQLTKVIERTLRELGVRSIVIEPDKAPVWLRENPPKAIILSGGDSSVYKEDAPHLPNEVLELIRKPDQPVAVLGICYGMQLLAYHLGGEVKAVSHKREYGEASINLTSSSMRFFAGTARRQQVWISHGDSVVRLPVGFGALAHTDNKTIAAMANGRVIGVQFHPEVAQTIHGKTMLANFLQIAGCESDWTPSSIIGSIQDQLVSECGDNNVITGYSGGVDSSVLAKIAGTVLGDRLQLVTINAGNLRAREISEIRKHAASCGGNLRIIDSRQRFYKAMKGVTDAEEKRKRFKKAYTAVFVRAAKDFNAPFFLQGSLAPDLIESGATGGANIKSHHNVGNDFGDLQQLHPLGGLFKYEVRALARELGLPESICNRQPFPGPGLFIRVIGVPPTRDIVEIVRWSDARVKAILVKYSLWDKLSQVVTAYFGIDTVGVKGDARVYSGSVVVRAVNTLDFMTAEGVIFPAEVMREINSTLTSHPRIVRALFDPTHKPPATTEFE